MKRQRVAQLALVAALIPCFTAGAHSVPARRAIIVQAEADRATLLVAWQPAADEESVLPALQAQWGRNPEQARDALRGQWTARALADLALELDGSPAQADEVNSKLLADGPRGGVAVLLTVRLPPGDHTLRVRAGAETRLQWRDSSGGRAQAQAPQEHWQPGTQPLEVDWLAEEPGTEPR